MRLNLKNSLLINLVIFELLLSPFAFSVKAQEQPPTPQAPRPTKIPTVVEKKLPNGLTVATVDRKNVPLVTVQILIHSGASVEASEEAGLANLTASLLTKGTRTRTASQIAEQMEFLGATLNSGAGWNQSVVTLTVLSDKLDAAMAIMSDVVLNPKFDQKELDLLKQQTLDGLDYNLKQPGFLANFVASKYSFDEHPAGGTPETIKAITRKNILEFRKETYNPENATLIFTGDITPVRARALAAKYFGAWRSPATVIEKIATMETVPDPPKMMMPQTVEKVEQPILRRMLVVDLPDSGQASVNYTASIYEGRTDYTDDDKTVTSKIFYPALVLNSVLGGGYSSRLNQEIRIKRGLSYGAGSNFAWRSNNANFSTSTQTKNESAAEVAELVLAEIKKISQESISTTELAPRKLVLTGDFGRDLETTATLAQTVASLYIYDLPLSDLSSHIQNVNAVSDAQIKSFASDYFKNGDLIIVGDYSVFKDDLAKRFPNMKIEVIKADTLDLSKANLRK